MYFVLFLLFSSKNNKNVLVVCEVGSLLLCTVFFLGVYVAKKCQLIDHRSQQNMVFLYENNNDNYKRRTIRYNCLEDLHKQSAP
jgi:hypothetical protein